MSIAFAIGVYFIIWWLVLMAVIPFGVRTLEEEGEAHVGAPSAPVNPHLWRKVGVTTVIAFVIWLGVYAVFAFELIKLEDIPFPPRLDEVGVLLDRAHA